jgi:type IV secretion system protein VirD4
VTVPAPGWGPRPGGPQPPPPRASSGGPNTCFSVVMAVVGVAGLSALASGQPGAMVAGLVLAGGAGGYFGALIMKPGRERARIAAEQAEQARQADEWLRTRPESEIASAPDPLRAARAMTAATGGAVFVGVTPDFREWRTVEPQQAILVLGPPRSGKTSALIIPSILGAPGPVVSTSTKGDVMDATARARSQLGRIWLFDPSGSDPLPDGALPLRWSPVSSSVTWDGARAMADAMVDASDSGRGVENATYWTEAAKTLLGPLLHAAALGGKGILEVRRWTTRMYLEEAGAILDHYEAAAAGDDLAAIAQTEERERSSIFATARLVLNAYGADAAAERSRDPNFDAATFVRSSDTIYVTAPSHLQSMLAPLVVGLLEEVRHAAYAKSREAARTGAPPSWPLFWALDEVANIAPLKKLPGILSESGSQGVQVMACFQDLSQARARWKAAADGFLTLFGTKVVFPGIGDKPTLEALSTLVGDWDRPYTVFNRTTGTSSQFGFPLGVSFGSQYGQGYQYSARREALLSPAEIANIPPGNCLLVQANRWGLVEAMPFYRAAPWQAALRAAPPSIISRGGEDVVQLPQPVGEPWRARLDPDADGAPDPDRRQA